MLMISLVDVYIELEVGLVIIMVGGVVSKIIESLKELDIFPESSLYQTYTVLLPSPLLKVYETFSV